MDIFKVIQKELNVRLEQVEAAVQLIDEGNTIPFIARYRKEATGALNDEQLRELGERLTYLRNLEEKKVQVLTTIEEQGKLTEELRKEWGVTYDEKLKTAKTFLEKMSASKEEYDYFDSIIGNDAKFIKLLAKMGNSISEGNLGGFEGQGSGFSFTPQEAKQKLDEILNNPDDAYWAGARNKRNDMRYCREHNLSYVSEEERKARIQYVNSLMAMQG